MEYNEGPRVMIEPTIQLECVSKVYESQSGSVSAIVDFSLDIQNGEFISLVGPSGCGKTTVLKMIAGVSHPTGGHIKIDGRPLNGPPQSMGVALQSDALLPWRTVVDNVTLRQSFDGGSIDDYKIHAAELIRLAGLGGFEGHYPAQLSGGMRQRVAICRALVAHPEILLLDEPFGSLDAITRDQMALDLQRLWLREKSTVVLITHSISEAVFLSDRVVLLSPRPGRLQRSVNIDLPRPRTIPMKDDVRFLGYIRELRHEFESMGLYDDREASAD